MQAVAIVQPGQIASYTSLGRYGPLKLVVRSDFLMGYTDIWDDTLRQRIAFRLRNAKRGQAGFSMQSQTRLRKVVDLFFLLCEQKMIYNPINHRKHPFIASFITLTIPAQKKVSRKSANAALLNTFLTWLRANGGIYVWKCEFTKAGQVHYHILYSRFVAFDKVRTEWNRILRRAGLLSTYAQRYGHYNAPSTDVKGVINRNDLKKYLSKYVSKSNTLTRSKGGRVWGHSTSLSKIDFFSFYEDEAPNFLNRFTAKVFDHFTIWPDIKPEKLPSQIGTRFDQWLRQARQITNV